MEQLLRLVHEPRRVRGGVPEGDQHRLHRAAEPRLRQGAVQEPQARRPARRARGPRPTTSSGRGGSSGSAQVAHALVDTGRPMSLAIRSDGRSGAVQCGRPRDGGSVALPRASGSVATNSTWFTPHPTIDIATDPAPVDAPDVEAVSGTCRLAGWTRRPGATAAAPRAGSRRRAPARTRRGLARRDQPDLELRGRCGRGAAGGTQHQRRVAAAREPGQLRGPRAEQRRRPALGAAEERRDFARDRFGALGRNRPQQDPRVEQERARSARRRRRSRRCAARTPRRAARRRPSTRRSPPRNCG